MSSEIQQRAEFERIRYGQCWEDADVLVEALAPAGRRCVSIGSAGDNSFSLLGAGAEQVTAVEMNPAQVACIELRRAAYQELDHAGLLELLGVRRSERRQELWLACRGAVSGSARGFWDHHEDWLDRGPVETGKFEGYFRLFRNWVLPLAHPRGRVRALLEPRDEEGRVRFYRDEWDNRRWRAIFRVFFSRLAMGRLGRDPEFFRYVEGSVAERILERVRYAFVELEPARNPYLRWILEGDFGEDLPHALRRENFESIRDALRAGRFRIHSGTLESWLDESGEGSVGGFNLSDVFEYMSEVNSAALLARLADAGAAGARLVYWNMLAPRSRPAELAGSLRSLDEVAAAGFARDRAFFYSRLVVEEVL